MSSNYFRMRPDPTAAGIGILIFAVALATADDISQALLQANAKVSQDAYYLVG